MWKSSEAIKSHQMEDVHIKILIISNIGKFYTLLIKIIKIPFVTFSVTNDSKYIYINLFIYTLLAIFSLFSLFVFFYHFFFLPPLTYNVSNKVITFFY